MNMLLRYNSSISRIPWITVFQSSRVVSGGGFCSPGGFLQQVSQELVEVFSMTLQGVCKSFNGHQSCKKQRLFAWGMGWNVETWRPNLPLVGFAILFWAAFWGVLGMMWFEEIPGTSPNGSLNIKYITSWHVQHHGVFFRMPTRIPKHCRLPTYSPFLMSFPDEGYGWPHQHLLHLSWRQKNHRLSGAKGWGFIDFGGTDIFVHIKVGESSGLPLARLGCFREF